jgi:hypothetical protein
MQKRSRKWPWQVTYDREQSGAGLSARRPVREAAATRGQLGNLLRQQQASRSRQCAAHPAGRERGSTGCLCWGSTRPRPGCSNRSPRKSASDDSCRCCIPKLTVSIAPAFWTCGVFHASLRTCRSRALAKGLMSGLGQTAVARKRPFSSVKMANESNEQPQMRRPGPECLASRGLRRNGTLDQKRPLATNERPFKIRCVLSDYLTKSLR